MRRIAQSRIPILAAFLFAFAIQTGRAQPAPFARRLGTAAIEQTKHRVVYDPSYVRIPYPGGDVPAGTGVCTDVVIRSYRALGIDLQKIVHEDIVASPKAYPRRWGDIRPDTNIDHRRVPNLMAFFSRNGDVLAKSRAPGDYQEGDLVTWDLGGGVPHIGIVVNARGSDHALIVHNIGRGPQMEDVLFDWRITGHYRYPKRLNPPAR